ncbi:glycosyl transferase, partial [Streptomyces prunicolor]
MTTDTDQTTYPGGGSPSSWGPPTGDSDTGRDTAVHEPVTPADTDTLAPQAGEPKQPLGRRLWRGRPEDPRWARPAFWGMLLATALLYLYNLSASGYSNSFYSAAV